MERTRDPVAGFVLVELVDRVESGSGRLEAAPLRNAITAASAHGRSRLALDLSTVKVMDAEALGELAAASCRLRRAGGGLVLVNPQHRIRRMLAVTRLDTVLPIWSRKTGSTAVDDQQNVKTASSPGWLMSRVCQGRDLLIGEGVSSVLSAAAASLPFGARVSPVVR